MSEFKTELDTTSRTYLDQVKIFGGLTDVEFHFDIYQEYEIDFDGDERLAQVKITAIMFGGFGSKTNIFMDLSEDQQQNYESEIEDAMNDEGREYYGKYNQQCLHADDTAACTEHMDNVRLAA